MHPWQLTFPNAARGLSDRERIALAAPASAKPVWASPKNVVSSDLEGMQSIFGDWGSYAGPSVTPETAMRLSTAYRCTALLAGVIACLPLPIYTFEKDGETRKAVRTHPLWNLLNAQPTDRFTAATAWEFWVGSVLNRGDGIGVLVRNRAGDVIEIIPIRRECVVIERQGDRLVYYVADAYGDGVAHGFDQDDVLHLPGFGFNGVSSMSVVRWAAFQAIGTAIASEEYAGNMLRNGALQKVVITNPGDMTAEQLTQLRDRWSAKYGGSSNASNPFVMYGGMDVKTVSLSAIDAQLLESRKFQVEDICRAYGVPPWMVGHTEKTSSWGTGIEQQGIAFLVYSLMPHLNRFQQEINRKCFRINRYFCEFNVSGLLQADAQGRAKFIREAIGGSQGPGWMTINEARKKENLAPVDGGNELYTPAKADMKPQADPGPEPAPKEE